MREKLSYSKILLTLIVFFTLSASALLIPLLFTQKVSAASVKGIKIIVMSDIHFFDEALITPQTEDAFEQANASDRKMLRESRDILNAALKIAEEEEPDLILIPGDITRDGELGGHKQTAAIFEAFMKKMKAGGKKTKVLAINGNHDINNSKALEFNEAKTTPEDFKSIYKNLGYGDATAAYTPAEGKQGGLSYESRPVKGLTVLALDSGHYSKEANGNSPDEHSTSGGLTYDLVEWAKERARLATERGDAVIAMAHHLFMPHFDGQELLFGDYVMDNWQTYTEQLANAGVRYTFSGHMHANDIAEFISKSGNKLYDISTGSLVTYPSAIRAMSLTFEREDKSLTANLDIKSKYITTIERSGSDGKQITDFTAYSKAETTLSEEKINGMADSLILNELDKILDGKGLLNVLSSFATEALLGVSVEFDALADMLKTLSNGDGLGFETSIGSGESAVALKIAIKRTVPDEPESTVLSIDKADGSGNVFISIGDFKDMLTRHVVQIETVLKSPDFRIKIQNIVKKVFDDNYKLFGSDYNLGKIINTLYHGHLLGNESMPQDMNAVIENFKEGRGLALLIDGFILPEFEDVLATFEIDISSSFTSNGAAEEIMDLLKSFDGTVSEIIGSTGKTLSELVADLTLGSGMDIESILYQTMSGMANDTNFSNDIDALLSTTFYAATPTNGLALGLGLGLGLGIPLVTGSVVFILWRKKRMSAKS